VDKIEVARMEGVYFSYNGRPVLEGVSLKVMEGDFLALIGPNGSGKSTLLKLMLGLLKPLQGRIWLFGQNLDSFRRWDMVGYLPQHAAAAFNPAFPATVEEVVASGYYKGWGSLWRQEVKEAVFWALELVGIRDLAYRRIGELSGGQRQKAFLARALAKRPRALFLDEPTTGIDVSSKEEFFRLLEKLNREQGLTIVVVTHDIGEAFSRAKKIGCVRNQGVYIHEDITEVDQEHIAEVLGYSLRRRC